jgi:predicted nucleic-acid-binding protein
LLHENHPNWSRHLNFVTDPDDSESIEQHPAAVRTMSEKVFVSTSVVLEFEWVLRGLYQLPKMQIARILEALCGRENLHLEQRAKALGLIPEAVPLPIKNKTRF